MRSVAQNSPDGTCPTNLMDHRSLPTRYLHEKPVRFAMLCISKPHNCCKSRERGGGAAQCTQTRSAGPQYGSTRCPQPLHGQNPRCQSSGGKDAAPGSKISRTIFAILFSQFNAKSASSRLLVLELEPPPGGGRPAGKGAEPGKRGSDDGGYACPEQGDSNAQSGTESNEQQPGQTKDSLISSVQSLRHVQRVKVLRCD